jgi:hypothetical protein
VREPTDVSIKGLEGFKLILKGAGQIFLLKKKKKIILFLQLLKGAIFLPHNLLFYIKSLLTFRYLFCLWW